MILTDNVEEKNGIDPKAHQSTKSEKGEGPGADARKLRDLILRGGSSTASKMEH